MSEQPLPGDFFLPVRTDVVGSMCFNSIWYTKCTVLLEGAQFSKCGKERKKRNKKGKVCGCLILWSFSKKILWDVYRFTFEEIIEVCNRALQ